MKPVWTLTFAFLLVVLTGFSEAAAPVFVQAISSALNSIPMMGFPMSFGGGLTGAKLAVGGKLLYFLGRFGTGGQAKPPQMSQFGSQPAFSNQFSSGGAGFPGGQGMPGGNFMQSQQVNSPKPPDPMVLMQALSQQGINPLQLMQALGSAGIDPAQMLQAMSGGGGPGNRAGHQSAPAVPPARFQAAGGFGGQSGFPPRTNVPSGMGGRPSAFPPQSGFPPMGSSPAGSMAFPPQSQPFPGEGGMPHDFSDSLPPSPEHDVRDENSNDESGSEDDIESFFSFLKDMDDNKCISRLICDIGSDPDFLGEFTRNIDNIINSLDEVPSNSGAQEYMRILQIGRSEGGCAERFLECDDDAYEIVKSVAPSVGVPGMGTGDENQL